MNKQCNAKHTKITNTTTAHIQSYLVGHQLGPDDSGGSVEGELDGDGSQLELSDGVCLGMGSQKGRGSRSLRSST